MPKLFADLSDQALQGFRTNLRSIRHYFSIVSRRRFLPTSPTVGGLQGREADQSDVVRGIVDFHEDGSGRIDTVTGYQRNMGIPACPGIANLNRAAVTGVDLVPQNIEGNTTEQVRGGSAEAGIDSDDVCLGWVDWCRCSPRAGGPDNSRNDPGQH